jgi:diguanylate cyclase (GGDEF)-like protein
MEAAIRLLAIHAPCYIVGMATHHASERQALYLAQDILNTLREPFVVLDENLRVRMAGRSFYGVFQVSPDDTENCVLFDLGNGQWNIPSLRERLEEILREGATIEAYEVEHEFPTIGLKTFVLNARVVRTEAFRSQSILLAMEDITDRKNAEQKLQRLATTDSLTGLANRNSFNNALEKATKMARRFDHGASLLLLDLDRFKTINDTYGHPFGDALLRDVANNIAAELREVDLAARLGGDEFAVILVGANQKADIQTLAQRYIDNIRKPLEIEGQTISVGVSIGIALFPADADVVDDLIRRADLALYRAKDEGRNRYCMFTPDLET